MVGLEELLQRIMEAGYYWQLRWTSAGAEMILIGQKEEAAALNQSITLPVFVGKTLFDAVLGAWIYVQAFRAGQKL